MEFVLVDIYSHRVNAVAMQISRKVLIASV